MPDISAFQADAFQFDAFQIYDETTIDDGITTTIVRQKNITTSPVAVTNVTTPRDSNWTITA